MSVRRAGPSAVSDGGDLPHSSPAGGELSSHFLLKFLPELKPCLRKGRSCPVTEIKLSSSRFPSLYKGNQTQPCTLSCKALSKASLGCQCEVSAHMQKESFSPRAPSTHTKPETPNPAAKGFVLQAVSVAGFSLAGVCGSYPFHLGRAAGN